MLISILTEYQCMSTKRYNRLINIMDDNILNYYSFMILPHVAFHTGKIVTKYIDEQNRHFLYSTTNNKGFWRCFYI